MKRKSSITLAFILVVTMLLSMVAYAVPTSFILEGDDGKLYRYSVFDMIDNDELYDAFVQELAKVMGSDTKQMFVEDTNLETNVSKVIEFDFDGEFENFEDRLENTPPEQNFLPDYDVTWDETTGSTKETEVVPPSGPTPAEEAAAFTTAYGALLALDPTDEDDLATTTLGEVNAAIAAYNALSTEAKALVDADTATKLGELKTELEALATPQELAAEAFRTAHATALALAVGTVTVANKGIVEAAKSAYDVLDADVKTLLADEYALLTDLLAKIAELEGGGDPEGVVVKEVEILSSTSIEVTLSEAPDGIVKITDFAITKGTTGVFDSDITSIVGSGRIADASEDGKTYTFETLDAINNFDTVWVDAATTSTLLVPATTKIGVMALLNAPALASTDVVRTSIPDAEFFYYADSAKPFTIYWLVVPSTATTAPTVAQVMAGDDYGSVTVTASGSYDVTEVGYGAIPFSGLTEMTGYNLYYVTKVTVGDASLTSTDISAPVAVAPGAEAYIPSGTYTVSAAKPTEVAGPDYIHNDNDVPASGTTITVRKDGKVYTIAGNDSFGEKLGNLIGANGTAASNLQAGDKIVINNGAVVEVIIDGSALTGDRTISLDEDGANNIANNAKLTLTGGDVSTDHDIIIDQPTTALTGLITVKGGNVDVKAQDINGNIVVEGEAKVTIYHGGSLASSNGTVTVNAPNVNIVSSSETDVTDRTVVIGSAEGASATYGGVTLSGAGATLVGADNTTVNIGGTGGIVSVASGAATTKLVVNGTVTKITNAKTSLTELVINAGKTLETLDIGATTVATLTNLGGAVGNITTTAGAGTVTKITAASATANASVNLGTLDTNMPGDSSNGVIPPNTSSYKLTLTGGVKATSAQTITIANATGKLDVSGVTAGIVLTTPANTATVEIEIGTNALAATANTSGTPQNLKITGAAGAVVTITEGKSATVNGISVAPSAAKAIVTVVSADKIKVKDETASSTGTVTALTVSAAGATVDKTVVLEDGFDINNILPLTAKGPALVSPGQAQNYLIIEGTWGISSGRDNTVTIDGGAVDLSGFTLNTTAGQLPLAFSTGAADVKLGAQGAKDWKANALGQIATIRTTSANLQLTGTATAKATIITNSGVITIDNATTAADVTVNQAYGKVNVIATSSTATPIVTAVPGVEVDIIEGKAATINGVTYAPTTGKAIVTVDSASEHSVALNTATDALAITATAALTGPLTVNAAGSNATTCTYTVTGGADAGKAVKLINSTVTTSTHIIVKAAGGYVDITEASTKGGNGKFTGAGNANITAKNGQVIHAEGNTSSFAVNGVAVTSAGSAINATLSDNGDTLTFNYGDSQKITALTVNAGTSVKKIATGSNVNAIDAMTVMPGVVIEELALHDNSKVALLTLHGTIEKGSFEIKSGATANMVNVVSGGVLGVNEQLTIKRTSSGHQPTITLYNGASISAVFPGITISPPALGGLSAAGTLVKGTVSGVGVATATLTYGNSADTITIATT